MTSVPWRIVIGRLGRIGHGELKGNGPVRSEGINVYQAFPFPLLSFIRFSTRLEYSAEQEKPPITESPAKGNVPDVRHLSFRYSQHSQRVPGCHGAPGIIFHHAR